MAVVVVAEVVVVVVYVDLVQGTEVEKKRAKTGNAQIGVERKERKGREGTEGPEIKAMLKDSTDG